MRRLLLLFVLAVAGTFEPAHGAPWDADIDGGSVPDRTSNASGNGAGTDLGQALARAPIVGYSAPAWAPSTYYPLGLQRSNDGGKIYVCIQAGVSAANGGPTGTLPDIADGTARWTWVENTVVPWVPLRAYAVGERVVRTGRIYRVVTAGTSAAAGGPIGTAAVIVDGTVVWTYVRPFPAPGLSIEIFTGCGADALDNAQPPYLKCDATTGVVEVRDDVRISSTPRLDLSECDAKVVYYYVGGTRYRLFRADGPVAANSLVTESPFIAGGVRAATTLTPVHAVRGVTFTAASSGARVLVAEMGQYDVPVAYAGATPAPGDCLGVSTDSFWPDKAEVSTTACVGTATSAGAGGMVTARLAVSYPCACYVP